VARTRDAWQFFNFWHHLIFITFNIFHGPQRKIREAKLNRAFGCTVSSDNFGLVDDVASFDGWLGFQIYVIICAINLVLVTLKRCEKFYALKMTCTFFIFFLFSTHKASQPPTTIPPPTTEVVETTSAKKVVNYLPPVGQTTTMLYSVHMIDKGAGKWKRKVLARNIETWATFLVGNKKRDLMSIFKNSVFDSILTQLVVIEFEAVEYGKNVVIRIFF
jgi:hypothetical protein